jgi:hypothetical protein
MAEAFLNEMQSAGPKLPASASTEALTGGASADIEDAHHLRVTPSAAPAAVRPLGPGRDSSARPQIDMMLFRLTEGKTDVPLPCRETVRCTPFPAR